MNHYISFFVSLAIAISSDVGTRINDSYIARPQPVHAQSLHPKNQHLQLKYFFSLKLT